MEPQPRVLLVGMTGELTSLPNVEVAGSFHEALDAAGAHSQRVARTLRSIRCPSVVQARATGITPDAWDPIIVVASQAPNDLENRRLATLARTAGHATAVVCPPGEGEPHGRTCVVDANGDLRVQGVDRILRAHRLAESDLRVVTDLLRDAQTRNSVPGAQAQLPQVRTPPTTSTPASGLDALLHDVDVVIRVLGDVAALRRP
jgi:hypothetical protein